MVPLSHVMRVASFLNCSYAQSTLTTIDLKPPSLAVGVLEGNPKEQFGELTSAVGQRGGRFAVLDARGGTLRVYDERGNMVREHGRLGSGPGEFRFPRAMIATSGDTVAVLDLSLSRVSFFSTNTTRGFARSFQLDVPAWDFCRLDNWLFVAGFRARDSSIVRRLDLQGTELSAFGDPFPAKARMTVASVVSMQTAIACHPAQNLILVASAWYPFVRAYDAQTGATRWNGTLSGFEQTIIEPVDGGVSFRGPKSGFVHRVERIIPLDSTLVLVQLIRFPDVPNALSEATYYARLLRADTGREVGTSIGLHALAADGKSLFVADTTEYPRLIRTGYSVRGTRY